jgi:hypothetical protein
MRRLAPERSAAERPPVYDALVVSDGSFEVSAELLRRGGDVPAMVASLGERLEKALPTHVEYHPSRFGRKASLTVDLSDRRFRLELKGHRTSTWVDHIVRSVCVRSEDVAIDDWFDRLAAGLAAEAERNTTVRLALEESLS